MLGPRAAREDKETFMDVFQGCLCFAIPHKMFRKLLAQAPEGETKAARRQIKHAHHMRSLRYETPYPPPPRSRNRSRATRFSPCSRAPWPTRAARITHLALSQVVVKTET
jgi:hypothetical protein